MLMGLTRACETASPADASHSSTEEHPGPGYPFSSNSRVLSTTVSYHHEAGKLILPYPISGIIADGFLSPPLPRS